MWAVSVGGRPGFPSGGHGTPCAGTGLIFWTPALFFSPLANKGQHTGFEDLPWAPIDAKHLESKEELSCPGLAQQTRDIVTCTPCTQDCRGTAWPGLGGKGACSGEKGRGGREERLLFD